MTKICLLITKPPHSDESAQRMCGISSAAKERGMDVTIYLIGDGVLCAKRNQKGYVGQNLREAMTKGVKIKASENDLHARAMSEEHVESGVETVIDMESMLVEDVMENADRVISW